MKRLIAIAGALLVSVPLFARADTTYGSNDYPSSNRKDRALSIEPNIGIGGYTGAITDAVNGTGVAYGATATLRPDRGLSYELGYVGHSNTVTGTTDRLASNKVQANLKLGPQFQGRVAWRPYVMGGVAADFVTTGTSAFGLSNTTQGIIPLGAGADFFSNSPVRVGARAQYDLNTGLGGSVSSIASHPNGWEAMLNAAAVF